jgi:hypothetical protein
VDAACIVAVGEFSLVLVDSAEADAGVVGAAPHAQQAGGEDPGDLAGTLFGGEMLGRKNVRPHGDLRVELPTAAFAW